MYLFNYKGLLVLFILDTNNQVNHVNLIDLDLISQNVFNGRCLFQVVAKPFMLSSTPMWESKMRRNTFSLEFSAPP